MTSSVSSYAPAQIELTTSPSHISSWSYGIGDFGDEAFRVVSWSTSYSLTKAIHKATRNNTKTNPFTLLNI
jgi:hypothetical protein